MTGGAVLVLGATSPIARHAAAAYARQGRALFLAGRDAEELAILAGDLKVRYGGEVHSGLFDAGDVASHAAFFATALRACPSLSTVLVAVGHLPDLEAMARDSRKTAEAIQLNFTGVASILTLCANHLEEKRTGDIVVLSSVAGDRGRQSNYAYGAAKAGLNVYLEGLRNRLFRGGVGVLTVKLGFVDTSMTYGMKGLFGVASPRCAGEKVAALTGRRTGVVYVPFFWRFIMAVIRALPGFVFNRLKL